MAGGSGEFVPVLGVVDTGAFRTVLDFETGERLGIRDPTSSPVRRGTARTATGQEIPYYVHLVSIRVANNAQDVIEFPLLAAFADVIEHNLFGRDWLMELCLAMDREAVYFLKD